jgi:hypothetical protein
MSPRLLGKYVELRLENKDTVSIPIRFLLPGKNLPKRIESGDLKHDSA